MEGIYKARIIQGKDCGIEVYRLVVWRNNKLYLLKTHMSKAAAKYQWDALKLRLGAV
jgi:hypothetical protein